MDFLAIRALIDMVGNRLANYGGWTEGDDDYSARPEDEISRPARKTAGPVS